ncbi:Hypothetical_protein [Hexamita inflata]|uniref:Hypothetical_protein n=1 Tax=Hexamita inflata TaxID=28002 RepID=A0ABP1H9K7_9EUKA
MNIVYQKNDINNLASTCKGLIGSIRLANTNTFAEQQIRPFSHPDTVLLYSKSQNIKLKFSDVHRLQSDFNFLKRMSPSLFASNFFRKRFQFSVVITKPIRVILPVFFSCSVISFSFLKWQVIIYRVPRISFMLHSSWQGEND